jgi:hypothetical protein
MQYVGQLHGQACYAPLDAEDVKAIGDQRIIACDMKGKRCTLTELQNRSIHLYCQWVSDAFNAAGYGMGYVMSKLSTNTDMPWSMLAVKERLWRVTQKHTFIKDSTTTLNTDEVGIVYEALNQAISEKLGVVVNFPDKHMKMYEEANQ